VIELLLNAALLTPPTDIDGLLHVHKQPRAHWYNLRRSKVYEYQLDGGGTFTTAIKLKKVKDLRPYNEAHPVRAAVVERCDRWEPVFAVGGTVIQTIWAVRSRFQGR
jgi:hypothetical protein